MDCSKAFKSDSFINRFPGNRSKWPDFKVLLSILPAAALAVACGTHSAKKRESSDSTPPAAGDHIDAGSDNECGKVLDGDLFNKVRSSKSSVEHDLAQMRFFTLSDSEAWIVYQTAKQDASSGGGLDVDVIGIVDVNGNDAGSQIHNFSDFKLAFARSKKQFDQYFATDRYKNASDAYSSIVRDPASINAWSSCIKETSGAPKFRVVLNRQSKSQVLAQVFYSSGAFAGSPPRLDLSFSGARVHGVDGGASIGQGSKIFTLDIEPNDESIGVSGTIQDGNTNFSFVDKIPPSKEEFQQDRCHMQNALMLLNGKVAFPIYSALEQAGWVAFPVEGPSGHGSEACTSWLADL